MAIKNITDPSGLFERNIEPTWRQDSADFQSTMLGPSTNGTITGRGAHSINIWAPAGADGLDASYDPRALFIEMMGGGNAELALGTDTGAGAAQYFGASVTTNHLTYALAPDLSAVDIVNLNIPNPYTPDISADKTTAADYKVAFESKHPGTRNSFSAGIGRPGTGTVPNNLDLDAGGEVPTLSPSNTRTRTGGWMHDTSMELGRWSTDSAS